MEKDDMDYGIDMWPSTHMTNMQEKQLFIVSLHYCKIWIDHMKPTFGPWFKITGFFIMVN